MSFFPGKKVRIDDGLPILTYYRLAWAWISDISLPGINGVRYCTSTVTDCAIRLEMTSQRDPRQFIGWSASFSGGAGRMGGS